ncbi:hybrid sensor histidine kinase/response regulator [Arenibaculum sp.]|uniref:hybrid sensor histidine kinase/response regulator n=1 Tax=Arenibaculum sp. TaxID=2865862 RepID=UPI002E0FB1B0|nr:ATP-binding protein [Arenibaculum sp.]
MSRDAPSILLQRGLFAAAVLVPLLAFAAASWHNRIEVVREAEETIIRTGAVLHEHARKVFETHDLVLGQIDEHIRGLSWDEISSPETSAYLARLNEPLEQAVSIWITDADGIARAGSRPFQPGASAADRDYFRAQRERDAGLFVGTVFKGRVTGISSFAVSRRRTTADGRFDGIIHVSVSPEYFAGFFAQASPPIDHAAVLIRADGEILAREPRREENPPLGPDSPLLREIAREPEGGHFVARSTIDGVERHYAYRKVEDFPLYVGFGVDTDAVLSRWRRNVLVYGLVAGLASLVLLGTSWLALRGFRSERAAHLALRREAEQRAEAEERLRQAQKMDALGQITGGVAHDFNNLLQALSGCLALIDRRAKLPEIRPLIEAGQQAIDRGAKLVQQMMAFSRRQALRPEPIDVRDRVLAMSQLLDRVLRADIPLETEFGPGLWTVEVDPTQFELALINLAVNARDAMPEGGTLAIGAANATLGPGDPSGLTGDFVRLWVSDTGCGMPPEVAARAFDPFFTTKPVGEGTGLGLSQVHGLAHQSGGTAWIESTPGAGTTVVLLLRRSLAPVGAADGAVAPVAAVRRDGRRILMVEDDPVVASTVGAALAEAGYEVARVSTADDALPLLASRARIDLLFSDVVMPGKRSGIDLAMEARRLRPELPVILTTGYSEKVARADGFPVLAKPYRIDDLIRALDAALAVPAVSEEPGRPG